MRYLVKYRLWGTDDCEMKLWANSPTEAQEKVVRHLVRIAPDKSAPDIEFLEVIPVNV